MRDDRLDRGICAPSRAKSGGRGSGRHGGALTNQAVAIFAFKNVGLTRREADVLLWIARGQSNAEIGTSLRISPRTVKKHLEHIFKKLGVKTRLAAAVKAGEVYLSGAAGARQRFARPFRRSHAPAAARAGDARTEETGASRSGLQIVRRKTYCLPRIAG